LLNATNEHQKPLKLAVVAATLPKVYEPADDLDIVGFVVTSAVDAIWRRQQVWVCAKSVGM
jgi:hypothetical protein